jgi:methylthioribose-1-phosphate isomerase
MKINGKHYQTIWFDPQTQKVKIIDQTLLPFQFKIIEMESFEDVVVAIKSMKVRGAPLIGATAAYGMYYAAMENNNLSFLKIKADELKQGQQRLIYLGL